MFGYSLFNEQGSDGKIMPENCEALAVALREVMMSFNERSFCIIRSIAWIRASNFAK